MRIFEVRTYSDLELAGDYHLDGKWALTFYSTEIGLSKLKPTRLLKVTTVTAATTNNMMRDNMMVFYENNLIY